MTAQSRILDVVTSTGPRKRRILETLPNDGGSAFRALLQTGRLVQIGSKRGTVYGTPAQAAAAKKKS